MKKIIKSVRQRLETLKDAPIIGDMLTPKPVVSVVRLSGVIAEGSNRKNTISYNSYSSLIEDAFDVYNLKAVALVLNCPGGSPSQSELIAQKIRRLADEKQVPVIAFVEDVAASGGYWLACAADEIYACNTSIVGSIGVISASFGFQKLIEKHGIERRLYTAGQEKSFLDPFLDEKEDDLNRLKGIQKDLHEKFVNWVRQRRADKLDEDDLAVFEGGFWLADHAQELGLIDGTAYIDDMLKERYGDDVKAIAFSPERGFLSSILGGEAALRLDTNLTQDVLDSAQRQAVYARYGL